MRLNIPFFENTGDGNRCLQVSMLSAIKYFDHSSDLDEVKLDKFTGRSEGKWTYTIQGVAAFLKLGYNVKLFSIEDLELCLGGENYILEKYRDNPEKAKKIIEKSDINALVQSTKAILDKNCFEQRVPSIKEIEEFIKNGNIVIALVDWNIIENKKGIYSGHFIVLTGFDENNFYAHNSGPGSTEQNMKIEKQLFLNAWKEADNDLLVIFGKV